MNKIKCNKNCNKCKNLNTRIDNKGYPFTYECIKYNDTVFLKDFNNTKIFLINK